MREIQKSGKIDGQADMDKKNGHKKRHPEKRWRRDVSQYTCRSLQSYLGTLRHRLAELGDDQRVKPILGHHDSKQFTSSYFSFHFSACLFYFAKFSSECLTNIKKRWVLYGEIYIRANDF